MTLTVNEKRKRERRKFGQAAGRNARTHWKTFKKDQLKLEEKQKVPLGVCQKDNIKHCAYQLLKVPVYANGRAYTKFIARRMRVRQLKSSKFVKLSGTALKFIIKEKSLDGYRIINLEKLQEHVVDITSHICFCQEAQELAYKGKSPVTLRSEVQQTGLVSIIQAECLGCHETFPLQTSPKHDGLFDLNVRAVWGTISSGGGLTNLNEVMGTMNAPQMSNPMFTSLEQKIGQWWHQILKQEMLKAGEEERVKAIEREDYYQGIPAITVVCDGGWSKRTHKHSYNALGGVGVIFGAETGKLLHIGVRNKHCVVCNSAQRQNRCPPNHDCFKNWNNSSQSMESDIILNGFLEAENEHGVRYMRVIADGDSSMYQTLLEKVPVWGTAIQKLECANHACKCLRVSLEKLVQEKRFYRGKGKLSNRNIVRLTTAVRCAIRMRSKDKNSNQLKHDIKNSILHVLGFHNRCSDFCKHRPIEKDIQNEIITEEDTLPTSNNSMDDIFETQCQYWNLPSKDEEENCRYSEKNIVELSEVSDIIRDVSVFLNRLADKSNRLLGNFTTNLAENWMSIRCKFDGGKNVNRCSKGSWHTRCYGGALRKNLGVSWSPVAFQTATTLQAGSFFQALYRKKSLKSRSDGNYRKSEKGKAVRRKRKLESMKNSTCKKARLDYGTPLDDTPDVSMSELENKCEQYLKDHVSKSEIEIQHIEQNSRRQSQSELWMKERRCRLTSSNFGKVFSRRLSNVSSCLVKTLLYNKFSGNINTVRGLAQEDDTILEYKNIKGNIQFQKVGLIISKDYPFLASSPDGMVKDNDEEGLVEIKNLLQNNRYTIKEAITKVPNFCLQNCDGTMHLKKNHEIYFQIQGQLNIIKKQWCDFILRRTKPYEIFIERIYRDEKLWETMLVKLKTFYMKFILPELACPRHNTVTGIRTPASPWYEPPADHAQQKDRTNSRIRSRQSQELPGTSEQSSQQSSCRKSSRSKARFVGKRILHEWVVDVNSQERRWYEGLVIGVVKGRDGWSNAVYEVKYNGEDGTSEVHLQQDLDDGSLKLL